VFSSYGVVLGLKVDKIDNMWTIVTIVFLAGRLKNQVNFRCSLLLPPPRLAMKIRKNFLVT